MPGAGHVGGIECLDSCVDRSRDYHEVVRRRGKGVDDHLGSV